MSEWRGFEGGGGGKGEEKRGEPFVAIRCFSAGRECWGNLGESNQSGHTSQLSPRLKVSSKGNIF